MADDGDGDPDAILAIYRTANRLARRMGAEYQLESRWRDQSTDEPQQGGLSSLQEEQARKCAE